MESGYISVKGLKALKVLNMDKEVTPDYNREEIERNLKTLKSRLEVLFPP
jgi:hypothetical protein